MEQAGDLEGAVRAALDHPGPALVDCQLAVARTIIKDQVDKLRPPPRDR